MIMRAFLVIGNKASTEPFSLNDLPGAGRMDILCRCVAQALLVSHGIRKNNEVYLLLLGPPNPPKALRIVGSEVRNLSPDERNVGGLIRKALGITINSEWKKSSPGFYVAKKDLDSLLNELSKKYEIIYLREDGKDIREIAKGLKNPLFVLGDHLGLKKEDEEIVLKYAKFIVSVSPLSLQADQCITIVNYELDRISYP